MQFVNNVSRIWWRALMGFVLALIISTLVSTSGGNLSPTVPQFLADGLSNNDPVDPSRSNCLVGRDCPPNPSSPGLGI